MSISKVTILKLPKKKRVTILSMLSSHCFAFSLVSLMIVTFQFRSCCVQDCIYICQQLQVIQLEFPCINMGLSSVLKPMWITFGILKARFTLHKEYDQNFSPQLIQNHCCATYFGDAHLFEIGNILRHDPNQVLWVSP